MLPYNFFEVAASKQQYIVYGDSVCESMTTIILSNNVKNIMTFGEVWDWLSPQVEQFIIGEKEYLNTENFDIQIVTYNSKLDKLEFNNPKHFMRHKINQKICRLNITNDQYLDVTNDHSLLHYNGNELIEIKPKDAQYLPVIRNQFELDDFKLDFIYYILGLWFADGSFSKSDYLELTDYLKQLDITFKPYLRNVGKQNDFQFNYKPVRNILLENDLKGVKSPDRYLSNKLFEDLKTNMTHFISFFAGYYTGDGSFSSGSGVINFNSSNKKILKQLKDLFLYYGMYSHILIDKNGRKYKDNIVGDMYKLAFIGVPNSIFNFLNQFNIFKDCKKITPTSLNYGRDFNSVGHNNKGIVRGFEYCDLYNIKPVKITSKDQILYSGYVYDFTESNNQNFMANGILVHNTDSLYINIPGLIPTDSEDAVKKANEVSVEINNVITQYVNSYLLPRMGVDQKYNRIDFKTELVCDALLLLDVKKNYAYRLLAKEGKILDTPKTSYTNLTIVKSDTPKFTKDFLKQMIEDIIFNPENRGKNLTSLINDLAHRMKAKLDYCVDNFEFHYIGTPKKWGTGYKNDPWQVTAMRLFNTVMDQVILTPMSGALMLPLRINNTIEFESKIAAMRNKHALYIDTIPISKLTTIAFPHNYDKEQVQKAFNYYGIGVNVNECWDKLFNVTCRRIIDIVKRNNIPSEKL